MDGKVIRQKIEKYADYAHERIWRYHDALGPLLRQFSVLADSNEFKGQPSKITDMKQLLLEIQQAQEEAKSDVWDELKDVTESETGYLSRLAEGVFLYAINDINRSALIDYIDQFIRELEDEARWQGLLEECREDTDE